MRQPALHYVNIVLLIPLFFIFTCFSPKIPTISFLPTKGTDRRKTPPTEGRPHKMKHFNTTNIQMVRYFSKNMSCFPTTFIILQLKIPVSGIFIGGWLGTWQVIRKLNLSDKSCSLSPRYDCIPHICHQRYCNACRETKNCTFQLKNFSEYWHILLNMNVNFVAIYAPFVWRKLQPKILLVEKKTNMRYE